MKVTVCFGPVKVIVPCGEGDLSVQELIERAVSRYKKASYKNALDHVSVRWLETSEDNAILDPDDRVSDVCDDRDKLIAVYDEKVRKRPSNNGDGTSASSVGTASPDIFANIGKDDEDDQFNPIEASPDLRERNNNLIVASEGDKFASLGKPAHVPPNTFFRNDVLQGSVRSIELQRELREEQQNIASSRPRVLNAAKDSWRSRDAGPGRHRGHTEESAMTSHLSSSDSPVSSPEEPPRGFPSNFQRTSNRKSLSAGHPMLYSWIDAQDRMFEDKYLELSSMAREEPAGSSLSSPKMEERKTCVDASARRGSLSASTSGSEEVELDNRHIQNLGLQVKGYKTADGRELGLIVVNVAQPGADKRDPLQVADRITEVNGMDLRSRSNKEAEELFNDALKSQLVKVKRTRSHRFVTETGSKLRSSSRAGNNKLPDEVAAITKEAPRPVPKPVTVDSHTEQAIEAPDVTKPTAGTGTPRGSRITIELAKGKDGLGFSITSRDVMTSGGSRIFIKNILNRGAAIEDGRLKIGDEIIEVNGESLAGKQQSDVTKLLRSAQGTVKLLIERTAGEETPEPVEDVKQEVLSTEDPEPKPDVLSLTIPLTTLGSAGLGISVKTKTSGAEENAKDLGIFVKSVLKGGAAAKDGRLQQGDQLLCLDDTSLIGLSNADAMETLRCVMQDAIKKGSIKLIISRSWGRSLSRTSSRKDKSPPDEDSREKGSTDSTEIDGVKVPTSLDLPTQNQFDSKHLSKPSPRNRSPVRNQSYFRAVDRTITSEDGVHQIPQIVQVIRKPPVEDRNAAPRAVSVNSVELPTLQPTKSIYIEKRGVLSDSKTMNSDVTTSGSMTAPLMETKTTSIPPPYNEAVYRKFSLSSGGKISSDTLDQAKVTRTVGQATLSPTEETGDLVRAASVSSQLSIDSLMIGPTDMPFSRDAFGRLSMSERKGRAHLDATKSDFYTKLKKFKSMEDISKAKSDETNSSALDKSTSSGNTRLSPFGGGMRRSESADTILSRGLDETDETPGFSRNAVFNAKSPMVGPRATSPPSTKTSVKLREPKDGLRTQPRARPSSCIIETSLFGRSRSTAWNDSFRNAVDKTPVFYSQSSTAKTDGKGDVVPITWTSNAQYLNEKQRKKSNGFLKGLGNIFKLNKAKKASPPSPEVMTLGRRSILNTREKEEALLDFPLDARRPKSLHEDVLRDIRTETIAQRAEFAAKLHQREKKLVELKRELSQADRKFHNMAYAVGAEEDGAKKVEKKTSEGRSSAKDILNALSSPGAQGKETTAHERENSALKATDLPTTTLSRADKPEVRGSLMKQDASQNGNRAQAKSRRGTGEVPKNGMVKRELLGEKRLPPNNARGSLQTRNVPSQKVELAGSNPKTRLDQRQVSLPRQLVAKKTESSTTLRTTTHGEAEHFRKVSFDKHHSFIEHQELKKMQMHKEKLDIKMMSENGGITVSHKAQI